MKIALYQVDAFSGELFKGNPAAVCPLDEYPESWLMQAIAAENNLAETAFYVPRQDSFDLRWFTPKVEVALCGHATLAAAHVLYSHYGHNKEQISFNSKSGILRVSRSEDLYILDFPTAAMKKVEVPESLERGLGFKPDSVYKGDDYLVICRNEMLVIGASPDLRALAELDGRGVIITALGDDNKVDFVSRFFAPNVGVDEDPVTGSAHTLLIPYWSKRLGKTTMKAHQLSPRGGELFCEYAGERVKIGGQAVTYLSGEITI